MHNGYHGPTYVTWRWEMNGASFKPAEACCEGCQRPAKLCLCHLVLVLHSFTHKNIGFVSYIIVSSWRSVRENAGYVSYVHGALIGMFHSQKVSRDRWWSCDFALQGDVLPPEPVQTRTRVVILVHPKARSDRCGYPQIIQFTTQCLKPMFLGIPHFKKPSYV